MTADICYNVSMIRTQIQLPERDYAELREVAARRRTSMADCIREGIRLFLGSVRGKREELDELAGKFRPVPDKDLKPHDRWVAEAIVASKKGARRRS